MFTQVGGPIEARVSLNQALSDEQEALLGCGPFFGTDCEADGVDFLFAEAGVLLQSFVGAPGDYGAFIERNGLDAYCIGCADDHGNALPVPGTSGFGGELPGVRSTGGQTVQIPGSRAPDAPGYDPNADGTTTALTIPLGNDFGLAAGLPFRSEMAALSWNLMMTLVAFSQAPINPATGQRDQPAPDQLDLLHPMRTGPGLCSFRQPQFCALVENVLLRLLAEDPRGVPLLRWDWEASNTFEITSATGDLADFVGGLAHVIGPEPYESADGNAGVSIALEPPPGVTPPVGPLVGAFGSGPDQIPDTEDDAGRRHGWAYGTTRIPEPSSVAASLIALATIAVRRRWRSRLRD
jgi:hypothetical protein